MTTSIQIVSDRIDSLVNTRIDELEAECLARHEKEIQKLMEKFPKGHWLYGTVYFTADRETAEAHYKTRDQFSLCSGHERTERHYRDLISILKRLRFVAAKDFEKGRGYMTLDVADAALLFGYKKGGM